MEKIKIIKCDGCGKTIEVGITKGWNWGKWGDVWNIPKSWSVTIPKGWLCPDCSKGAKS